MGVGGFRQHFSGNTDQRVRGRSTESCGAYLAAGNLPALPPDAVAELDSKDGRHRKEARRLGHTQPRALAPAKRRLRCSVLRAAKTLQRSLPQIGQGWCSSPQSSRCLPPNWARTTGPRREHCCELRLPGPKLEQLFACRRASSHFSLFTGTTALRHCRSITSLLI